MQNYIYAVNKSFEEMKQTVSTILNRNEYGEKERQELFFCIGTCIHWILDYAARLEIKEDDKKYISAFRYINNSLKHAFEVKEISSQRGGITFPLEFPVEIPERQIVWTVADNDGRKCQKNNYYELLNNQSVISTSEKVIALLKRYS